MGPDEGRGKSRQVLSLEKAIGWGKGGRRPEPRKKKIAKWNGRGRYSIDLKEVLGGH